VKITTKVQKKFVDNETEIRLRQQELAKTFQDKGIEQLDILSVESAEVIRKDMALQLETSWPQNLLLQPWAEGFELIMLNW
jgi:hypothetical protein